MTTPSTAARYRAFKVFLDHLATLRYVAIYPVQWDEDPTIYRTQLKGTQAQGFTCVHCDQLPTEADPMIAIGRNLDTDCRGPIFAHITCMKGEQ